MKRILHGMFYGVLVAAALVSGLITFNVVSPRIVAQQVGPERVLWAALSPPAPADSRNPIAPDLAAVIPPKDSADVSEHLRVLRTIRDKKAILARAEKETIVKIKVKLLKYSKELESLEKELSALDVPADTNVIVTSVR